MMKRIAFIFVLLWLFLGQVSAQKPIPIWEGYDVSHGKQVTLTPFIAEDNKTGISVIVCPGGSYFWLDDENEGDDVAQWLQQNGITAFVLRYRAAGFGAYFWHHRALFRGKQYPDMLTDAQRALQWVRQHAREYHINPRKVGMMGFSAGGHLVMSAACFHRTDFIGGDLSNLRPAFVAPIYPVVTMNEPYAHRRSRRALLSEKHQNDSMMRDSLSLERHIPKNCPPVFLVNCIDDPVVDYHNSLLLDSALTAHHVNHFYTLFQTGGHGFGVSEEKGSEECLKWKLEFLNWVQEINH